MQRFINALPDTDDPRVLYEIRQTQWGGLRLIQITHDFGPPPDAWMNNPKITGDSLCAEYLPAWLTQSPLLRRMLCSRLRQKSFDPVDLMKAKKATAVAVHVSLGTESIYLDPG